VIDLAFFRAYKEQCILFAVLLAALRECVELAAFIFFITCGLSFIIIVRKFSGKKKGAFAPRG